MAVAAFVDALFGSAFTVVAGLAVVALVVFTVVAFDPVVAFAVVAFVVALFGSAFTVDDFFVVALLRLPTDIIDS